MWLVELLKLFAAALKSGFDYGTAVAPTEKMKEQKADRELKRLTANEYDKQLRKLSNIIFWRPRQSVDALVNLNCDGYDPDDIQDFRIALYERYPKRKHIKDVDKN